MCELDYKESWVLRIDAFELWYWRRLLRVPWTARRSNQSILNEISPGCSLEGLMLKLKLQYIGHLLWRTASLEKTLILGKIEGRTRRGWQRMRWLSGITDLIDMSLSKSRSCWWTGKPGVLQCMESDTTEILNELMCVYIYIHTHMHIYSNVQLYFSQKLSYSSSLNYNCFRWI